MSDSSQTITISSRRSFLKSASALSLMALGSNTLLVQSSSAATLTDAKRNALSSDDVIAIMKAGNQRFINRRSHAHNYIHEQRDISAAGQFPAAVILSCIDSRAPAEILMDLGIGDVFNIRIAGNVSNPDVLGSMEFACKVAGAKVVLVMGHTKCGAVKGAIDQAKLGNLTDLLEKIKPAISATSFDGDRSANNYNFVDAVAKQHVALTAKNILAESKVLEDMVKTHQIKVVSSMYDIQSGKLEFF